MHKWGISQRLYTRSEFILTSPHLIWVVISVIQIELLRHFLLISTGNHLTKTWSEYISELEVRLYLNFPFT